ncbi:hypothetical protein [Priestia megaterium]|uniref:hypothetical protein n=1 Tax=Priestia megaterium TaxID=1404 RepID=UPI000BF50FEA|nr:hypothetical protein [Priestia megaterium]PFR90689.1 hypothetical protein COK39_24655 [Priestia megaterium]
MFKEVARIAKVGETIKVTQFSCQGWGKTAYEVGSMWKVKEVRTEPYGITFCEDADGFIWNYCYVVLEKTPT